MKDKGKRLAITERAALRLPWDHEKESELDSYREHQKDKKKNDDQVLAQQNSKFNQLQTNETFINDTLRDFQALLEKQEESQQDAKWGEISSNDFYYDDAVLASKNDVERSVYLWDNPNAFGTTRDADWLSHYTFIYHTNTVL